jgi:predicted nucleic acid-binding protein
VTAKKGTSAKQRRRRPPSAAREARPSFSRETPPVRYIETSALLAALLEQDASAMSALESDGRLVTSSLTFAEANRALVRARVASGLTPATEAAAIVALGRVQDRCTVLPVSDDVLSRAGRPFPVEPIRTLDAVHLATLELVADAPQLTTIITRDTRIRANAKALGYVLA